MLRSVDSQSNSVADVVSLLSAELTQPNLRGVVVFTTLHYDLAALGTKLQAAFSVPVVGCTSAGVIGPSGYFDKGVTAVGFYGVDLSFRVNTIETLADCTAQAVSTGQRVRQHLASLPSTFDQVAILLTDGLSGTEERLCAALHAAMPDVAMVGGSAADRLTLTGTSVLTDGQFRNNRALFVTIAGPFRKAIIHTQQFVPDSTALVVTDSRPEKRLVLEFDGEPAAKRYAELLGIEIHDLNSTVFAQHPLLARFAHTDLVRSIQTCVEGGGVKLYCALQDGEVFRLGKSEAPLEKLAAEIARARDALGDATWQGALAFDCVLRRMDFAERGILESATAQYLQANMVGFATYGEQVNARHMNHTLAGVAFGKL